MPAFQFPDNPDAYEPSYTLIHKFLQNFIFSHQKALLQVLKEGMAGEGRHCFTLSCWIFFCSKSAFCLIGKKWWIPYLFLSGAKRSWMQGAWFECRTFPSPVFPLMKRITQEATFGFGFGFLRWKVGGKVHTGLHVICSLAICLRYMCVYVIVIKFTNKRDLRKGFASGLISMVENPWGVELLCVWNGLPIQISWSSSASLNFHFLFILP